MLPGCHCTALQLFVTATRKAAVLLVPYVPLLAARANTLHAQTVH